MKLLLDTHLLLWAASEPARIPLPARKLIANPARELIFSAASLWEIAITELPVTSEHALALGALPSIHKDPFDRILAAQATVEGLILLTVDPVLARHGGPERRV